MPKQTIALLHPGDMGAALGACLVGRGHHVVWTAEGRSVATRARAAAAGLTDLGSLARTVEAADIVLSVCPPHGALDLADAVAALGFDGLYVDANAIAPDTTREVGAIVEAAGARFVDGGIIGPPPDVGGSTRSAAMSSLHFTGPAGKPAAVPTHLYFSGPQAPTVAALFEGSPAGATALPGGIGAASALKVCYAAWNKGSIALLAAIRTLAQAEGVDAALLAEWNSGIPNIAKRSDVITTQSRKAWRWISEMEEIASSFEAAGLPGGFHEAAADIYRRLEGFKDAEQPPAMQDIIARLRQGDER